MFIGHYAPAFAAKAIPNSPSLAVCVVAAQLVDIGFFSLSYFGIEKWRLDAGIAGLMPVDLYYMPFTHSLLASTIWALVAGGVTWAIAPKGRKAIAGSVVSVLVLLHWLLDLAVHRHDLGLLGDEPSKLGFGLWNYPMIEMPLEIGLLLAGFLFYLSSTRALGPWGRKSPWVMLAVLFIAQGINWFAPPLQSAAAFSALGLFAYALFAGIAWWLDRTRESRVATRR